VGWEAKQVIKEPLTGDVAMNIRIYIADHKWPDIDNVCKSLLDGMNGIAYNDDKQVAAIMIQRLPGDINRVEIELWEVA
jgi:crossover junction endodeoxyribonuclease RusA